jgi:HlyD family secretion protein
MCESANRQVNKSANRQIKDGVDEMKGRRTWIVLAVALLLAAGGGYFAYTRFLSPASVAQEPPETTLETATVTRGDIVITADGSGELVPTTELELTFHTSGKLAEILVEVGDQVQEDDVLARLETDMLERAAAEADVELEIAQLELADVREGPSDAELADAQAALRNAQVELRLAQAAYENTFDSNMDAAINSAKIEYDWWVSYYQGQKAKYEEGSLSQADHDWAMNAMISAEGRWQEAINQAKAEEVQAVSQVTQARNTVYQAQDDLELLESEPLTDTLARAELAVDQALLAREEARADLAAAQLYAPFDGIIMDVTGTVGEQVNKNTSVFLLADMHEPLLRFWIAESDMSSVAVGYPVNVVFGALPDDTFTGEIVDIDPVLVTVEGTSAVQAWARVELEGRDIDIFSGMTADVEIIAGESRNALLVPVEALREMGSGQYAVFVVGSDGELEMRSVAVGLMDYTSAEILDGLEEGDIVRVGGE